jgi:formylglycine-generating enzyme required for sulfatase activity
LTEFARITENPLDHRYKTAKAFAAESNFCRCPKNSAKDGEPFLMGSSAGEGVHDEHPQHEVALSPFLLGQTPITNSQFLLLDAQHHLSNKYYAQHSPDSDCPVIYVNYEMAVMYCRFLSGMNENRYRLPTEAEWEYACRAGTTTTYSFGDDELLLGDYGCHISNSKNRTCPVGQNTCNPWGLFDMHGNIREWCADWYCDSYCKDLKLESNSTCHPAYNPSGPNGGSSRVVRGGSWNNDACYCRSAARHNFEPTVRYGYLVGFRVCSDVSCVSQPSSKTCSK